MIDWQGVFRTGRRAAPTQRHTDDGPRTRDRHGQLYCPGSPGTDCIGGQHQRVGMEIPRTLGDSPIIGGGNYADDRYGAAACTGWGEAAIRAATARSVVLYLKGGYPLEEACREAFRDLAPILRGTPNVMSLVAIDRHGNHCAMTTAEERTYVYQTDGMDHFVELPRIVVSID